MATTLPRQTATILMFPTAGRRTAVNLSRQAKFAAEVDAATALRADYGEAWYHGAAIEEAARDRRN